MASNQVEYFFSHRTNKLYMFPHKYTNNEIRNKENVCHLNLFWLKKFSALWTLQNNWLEILQFQLLSKKPTIIKNDSKHYMNY